MLKIYGMMICPDCVECRKALDQAGIDYAFFDFSEKTQNLKAFLKLRDGNPAFDKAREAGNIGIPCIVREDGGITLDWETVM